MVRGCKCAPSTCASAAAASDKSPSQREKERPAEKSPPSDSKHKPSEVHRLAEIPKFPEHRETGNTSLLQKEDNGTPTAPHLVKQQRVSSQDSLLATPRPVLKGDIAPALEAVGDSPEPEYEEAADLSTSIAKLRCLLEQRAEAQLSNLSAGGATWWGEGAAECRGRTQLAHSERPVDTATVADEYDMNADRNSSPYQTTNNMQRLDKLFQRTVTGVFNSIKTAVGAEGEADGINQTVHDWTYVCTSIELSVGGAVARLVGSRRAYSHVDAALDSLDHLTAPPPKREIAPEDFEEWCGGWGAWGGCGAWGGWGAGAELACAAGLARAHVTCRLGALLCADLAESFINVYLDEVSAWLRAQVFTVFERLQGEQDGSSADREPLRPFRMEETCQAIVDTLPALQIFGSDTVDRSVRLTVSSFSHKDVNKDVLFRVLDLLTVHFKTAAGLKNPSFDNN